MDIFAERTKLVFRWHTPIGIHFYKTSGVLVKLGRFTTTKAETWTGYLRTDLIDKYVWNYLRVSLEFEGNMGKRIAPLFRGRVMWLEQSKAAFRPFSDHTRIAQILLKVRF